MSTRGKKYALLFASGAVLLQTAGCGAAITQLVTDQVVGTLVGTILTGLLGGLLGTTAAA